MSYDPRSCGAQCDLCPLNGGTVVPPESNQGARIAVVGEAPGEQEEKQAVPFIGPSGDEVMRALGAAQLRRRDLHITNVLLCRPPKNELDNLLAKISAENRDRQKRNKQMKEKWEIGKRANPWLPEPHYEALTMSPVTACRPRLERELADYRDIIALGGTAAKSVMNTQQNIMSIRGGFVEMDAGGGLPARRVMPTIHPSFVLRSPRYAHVFRNDIYKAAQRFRGVESWHPPRVVYHPSPEQLEVFLSQPVPYWTYDLETDGIEPLTAKIRCVGIGTATDVAIVGLLGRDGITRFYNSVDERRIIEVMKRFFMDDGKLKVGHNSGSYDTNCINAQWGIWPKPGLDTILLHRLVESELPHGLGFVGSMYTDAPSWKCYDGETEVLTPEGWVRFDALKRGVQVAQWNLGFIDFVEPRAYVDQPYSGKIWKLESQATDLMVTPDHKMIFKMKGTERLRTCMVQDLPKAGSLPHTGTLLREDTGPSEAHVRLLVAFQADGSWAVGKNGSRCMDFGFTKARKIERLKGILDELGLTYRVAMTGTVNPRTRIWAENDAAVDAVWYALGDKKHFGPWMLNWPLPTRLLFLDELLLWDGTKGAEHTNYNTTVEINADWVQSCAVVSGRAARKNQYRNANGLLPMFRVSLPSGSMRSRTWSKLEGTKREEVNFDGRIYCVSVPSGFIVVRRNGKVVVSGNTDREGRKLAFDAETDEQLHTYCAYDVSITAAVLPPLFQSVKMRNQDSLVKLDHDVQRICAEMHMVGMYVDQKKRLAFEQKYIKEIGKRLVDLRESAPLPDFNPGSSHQVRKILFGDWKLVAPVDERDRYTASGDSATSDDILRSLLTLKDLEPYQKDFVLKLRRYRKAQKLLGTYIVKLRPWSEQAELGWDEEEDFEDSELRKKYGIDRVGIVNPMTGRMYPGYNAHVAVTGRLSSSKPINAQNFPKGLRAMVVPQPGCVFIGADADQLELRIAAARWGAARYLRAFDANADPHSSTALACFDKTFMNAAGFPGGRWDGDLFIPDGTGKWTGDAKSFRDLAKRVQYASQYMATVETVHRVICQTETDNGDGTTSLPYLNLSLREVRRMHEAWLDGCPEFPKGWDKEIEAYRRQGYLSEPITGRRRDFLDGENPNELVNYNIQGSAAGLMNVGMIQLCEAIPVFKYGPGTGLINQCHDAMVLEVPADGATYDAEAKKWHVPPGSIPDKTMRLLEECMNATHPSLPGVRITATADIGGSWKDVG